MRRLSELLTAWFWALREQWRRHISMRELHRRLDALRAAHAVLFPPEWDTPEFRAESLRRIAAEVARGRSDDSRSS